MSSESLSHPARVRLPRPPGNNPAIAALTNGGTYQMVWHGANGDLWTSGTLTSGDTGLPMPAGTSPSIAAMFSVTGRRPGGRRLLHRLRVHLQ